MSLPAEPNVRMSAKPANLIGVERLSLGGSRMSLVDAERRVVKYLRLSVTDRCNFRCLYCMPEDGMQFSPRAEVLTFEEIVRLTEVFVSLGVTRVRLTGGEPLLRRDLVALVRRLSRIDGVEDLALSTNAFQLADCAQALRDAGLERLNISLDTLDPDRFRAITRTGELERVLAGIDAAIAAGFETIKLNTVVLGGAQSNLAELASIVRFAGDKKLVPRFIEFMPIGTDGFWTDESYVPVDLMLATLRADFDVTEAPARDASIAGEGPARYATLVARDGSTTVKTGFITAVSDHFCAACNRVRLTATGRLQECLAFPGERSLRDAMRGGASDDELRAVIAGALGVKGPGHRFAAGQYTLQSMSVTGG